MKRFISTFLAICMVLCLVACGQTAEASAEPAPAAAEASVPAAPEPEPEPEPAAAPVAAAEPETITVGSNTFTVAEAAERALAWQACSNLAGAHEDYHTALNHAGELEDLWVNEEPYLDTMSWTNNTQKMVGYDNVYAFYVTDLTPHIEQCTRTAASMDDTGEISADAPEWQGTGMFWYHMLMSPVIEVAADGQTAIGHWQSFGTVTEPSGGGYTAQWTCEDYNMVFVKQSDNQWKIWHLRTFVHFYTNVDNHWYEQNMATQGAGGMEVPNGVGVMADMPEGEMPEPPADMTPPGGDMAPPSGGEGGDYAEIGEYYQGFDLYCVPKQTGFVAPYETWADIEDTFLW